MALLLIYSKSSQHLQETSKNSYVVIYNPLILLKNVSTLKHSFCSMPSQQTDLIICLRNMQN